jgi:hypothetical protein
MSDYREFLEKKSQIGTFDGFDPVFMPDFLFDFQKALVEWAVRKGKGALFEDCGLGKTPQALVWAQNIVQKSNGNVLILTPLAVSYQFLSEGEKFGVEIKRSVDGKPASRISVSNYEKLHLFDPNDFVGVVCDESSILKHFGGSTQKHVTRFMSKMKYRLLDTATAAPNDYNELGTSSEAVGALGYSDMLSRFFNQDDKKSYRMNEVKIAREARTGNYYGKLAYRASQQIGQWKLKPHAEIPFWRYICSWARACRMPSDIGFANDRFILPELIMRDHVVVPTTAPDGKLFTMQAFGLNEEREERRRTLNERCELVAQLVADDNYAFIGCDLNSEGDLLEKIIPGAVQVAGKHSDEEKEERFLAFSKGQISKLVTKKKMGAWGMNYQHCAHVVTFASHSYEQWYQFIRRCWRFGQTRPVIADMISTEGEEHVRDNMKRKQHAADQMFTALVEHMNNAMMIDRGEYKTKVEVPTWL